MNELANQQSPDAGLRELALFAGAGGLPMRPQTVKIPSLQGVFMVTDSAKKNMSESAKLRCNEDWKRETSERMRTKIDDAKLSALYAAGSTQDECAKELGVSRKVVSNAMKRLGMTARRAVKRDQLGEKNPMWKGVDANLVCKHKRLYRAFGQPNKCDVCLTDDPAKTYDWANLTGDYDNPQDFKRMCRSCHAKYDKKIQNITKTKTETP